MVTVREVKTVRDMHKFVKFPLKLYKNNEYFVPYFYADEMNLLKGKTPYNDVAESAFFLAERDGKVVGRIHAIIQHQYNEKMGEKRVRFTRFDSIDDTEVSRALFSAAEGFGKSRGMTCICGPLGFTDLDREGMLIEGFDQEQTFEEQYNYDYYPRLVEDFGFEKEIDWLEFKLTLPEKPNEMLPKIAQRVLEMHELHVADTNMSRKAYVNKYRDEIFHCIDECYKELYGTVPITEEMRDSIVKQFSIMLSPKYLSCICDKNERVVAFALSLPRIADAIKKSGGRMTPLTLIKLLRAIRKPRVLDLGLVGVLPEYRNTGLNAYYVDYMQRCLVDWKLDHLETNLNLETNTQVMAQWKYLTAEQNKRRRAYCKNIV